MRTFVFGLAVIFPTFAMDLAQAADAVPSFDIAKNCQEEMTGAVTGGTAACKNDETAAKDQLVKRWSSFGARPKKDCIGESSTGGVKSYVELLTCLEMSTGKYAPTTDRVK